MPLSIGGSSIKDKTRVYELFLLVFFLITWTVNMCSLFDGWQNHASSDWLTAKREQDCQPWRRLFIQKKIYICCARFQLKKIWRMYNFFFRELEPIVVSKCMYIVYTFKHVVLNDANFKKKNKKKFDVLLLSTSFVQQYTYMFTRTYSGWLTQISFVSFRQVKTTQSAFSCIQ